MDFEGAKQTQEINDVESAGWADKAVERLGKEAFGYFFNK